MTAPGEGDLLTMRELDEHDLHPFGILFGGCSLCANFTRRPALYVVSVPWNGDPDTPCARFTKEQSR